MSRDTDVEIVACTFTSANALLDMCTYSYISFFEQQPAAAAAAAA